MSRIFRHLLRLLLCLSPLVAAGTDNDERILLVGIDSIPFELAEELTDSARGEKALFRDLRGPAAVINTFPSDSYPAWTGLLEPLGVHMPLGYIGQYFDVEEQRVRGMSAPRSEREPWRDFFDWRMEGAARKFWAYGSARTSSVKEIQQGLEAFMESDARFFSMYIMTTDALGHLHGPEALMDFLVEFDRQLSELKRQYPHRPFHTVMISDHGSAGGGEPLENNWSDVRKMVTAKGFNISSRIRDRDDVAIISLGLLTNISMFTSPGRAAELARVVAGAEGVDLCVVPENDGWRVTSSRGEALIQKQQHSPITWSYRTEGGDPLDYLPVIGQLAQTYPDADGWFPDHAWFAETQDHYYPDALYRIAQSFKIVRSPASVSCSLQSGYMFGPRATELLARPTIGRMRWTHGALHRDAALGFLMTDLPDWDAPTAVRFNDALDFLVPLTEEDTATYQVGPILGE